MPAAVAVKPVRFFSENRGLRVVRRSAAQQLTNQGTMVVTAPEVVYEFELGWLEVVPGQDLLLDGPWDEEAGDFALQDAVSWLRTFAQVNGRFTEVAEVRPDAGALLLAIAEAELAGDELAVNVIGDEEWALNEPRQDIVDRCKLALNRMAAKAQAAEDERLSLAAKVAKAEKAAAKATTSPPEA